MVQINVYDNDCVFVDSTRANASVDRRELCHLKNTC